jgi:hypothetical protein
MLKRRTGAVRVSTPASPIFFWEHRSPSLALACCHVTSEWTRHTERHPILRRIVDDVPAYASDEAHEDGWSRSDPIKQLFSLAFTGIKDGDFLAEKLVPGHGAASLELWRSDEIPEKHRIDDATTAYFERKAKAIIENYNGRNRQSGDLGLRKPSAAAATSRRRSSDAALLRAWAAALASFS